MTQPLIYRFNGSCLRERRSE